MWAFGSGIFAYFYPRSPCGERPTAPSAVAPVKLFLSTLSLRRATACQGPPLRGVHISIHALLAESDLTEFNTAVKQLAFLSTLSLRRATLCRYKLGWFQCHFYPRSPCGERPHHFYLGRTRHRHFYPRSPCGERPQQYEHAFERLIFLSTLSLRRATHKSNQ